MSVFLKTPLPLWQSCIKCVNCTRLLCRHTRGEHQRLKTIKVVYRFKSTSDIILFYNDIYLENNTSPSFSVLLHSRHLFCMTLYERFSFDLPYPCGKVLLSVVTMPINFEGTLEGALEDKNSKTYVQFNSTSNNFQFFQFLTFVFAWPYMSSFL